MKPLTRWLVAAVPIAAALIAGSRPPDVSFRARMLDGGANETAAIFDLDKDGKIDIISGENWYQGPAWTRRSFRKFNFTNNYIDNFSDLPIDVDGDGFQDLVTVRWFGKNVTWWKNPGKSGGAWKEFPVESGSPVEFAFLVDLDNDGQARELLPEFGSARTPLAWFEVRDGKWVKHEISDRSYGHGIGAGDINKDGRTDVLTPQGWLEAPADPRSPNWKFHAAWQETAPAQGASEAARENSFGFMYALDINGDGLNDMLTSNAHNYGVLWYEQRANGGWTRRMIDDSWSQPHATTLVDLNGDGQLDLVTGKRYMAHNGRDPGEREPLGVYWYEYRKTPQGVEWARHIVDYGTRMGGGMQIASADLDGDGDADLVCPGKGGLFLVENLTK